jgi:hypothetical protein
MMQQDEADDYVIEQVKRFVREPWIRHSGSGYGLEDYVLIDPRYCDHRS